jgi:hypothetical protein
LKIQGFDLQVEGDRNTVHELTGALREQMGNLLAAPQVMIDGQTSQPAEKDVTPTAIVAEPIKRKSRRGSRKSKGETVEVPALEFQHDTEKWGNPLQDWKTATKAIWLLFVVDKQGLGSEMSSAQIAVTFNKHFRHANAIVPRYVTRDLAKAKNSLVGEDSTKEPSMWYLTQAGREHALSLVADAKGNSAGVGQSV